MGVTIHVNGTANSLVHKGSMGIAKSTLPDVCKTPSPGGPIPIPYPIIISMSSDLKKGTKTVKVDGKKMVAVKGSEFSRCMGDEPGTAGGVKSSTNMKEATWLLYSFDVKIDGKNACRLSDKMMMNHGNTACLGGVIQKPVICSEQHDPQLEALEKSISGRFKQTEVKCGNPGQVQADGVNITEGASTRFAIARVHDSKALTSVSGPMSGQKVRDLEWKPKRPSDHAKGDLYYFDVAADGVKARSGNQFKFKEYPKYGPETKTHSCSSGVYGWTGKYDILFENDEAKVTIKIKLINRLGSKPASGGTMPAASSPVSATDKASMKADIEGKLSNKVKLYRSACQFGNSCSCPKPIKIVVDFVESGQHHKVNLFQGSGQANASNWTRVKTRANSWAHETGHLLGWYDEYTGGAIGSTPRWQANAPAHVMNVGLTVPPEYGGDFRDWLVGKTGETWNAK